MYTLWNCRQCLAALFKQEGTSTTCKSELLGQQHMLHHHINNWCRIQIIYMAGVTQIHKSQSTLLPISTPTHPEHEVLYLPLSITSDFQLSSCIPGLIYTECHIHVGQADNALNEVRWQLHITLLIIRFKCGQQQASQQLSQKSRALMAKFKNKMNQATNWYIAAYTALTTLDPDGSWASHLQRLDITKDLHLPRWEEANGLDEKQEVCGKGMRFRGQKQSENRQELSWIWRAKHGGQPSKVTSADEVNKSKSTSLYTVLLPLTWLCH